jgi:hypothetical protein
VGAARLSLLELVHQSKERKLQNLKHWNRREEAEAGYHQQSLQPRQTRSSNCPAPSPSAMQPIRPSEARSGRRRQPPAKTASIRLRKHRRQRAQDQIVKCVRKSKTKRDAGQVAPGISGAPSDIAGEGRSLRRSSGKAEVSVANKNTKDGSREDGQRAKISQ